MAAEVERALLAVLLLRRRRRRKTPVTKKVWARNWIARNRQQGAYCNLLRELNCEDPETFRQFHRIDKDGYGMVTLILAACCLHNFMVENNKHTYISVQDVEDQTHSVPIDSTLTGPSTSSLCRNPTQLAKQQRQDLAMFFTSEFGSVPWQDRMISNCN